MVVMLIKNTMSDIHAPRSLVLKLIAYTHTYTHTYMYIVYIHTCHCCDWLCYSWPQLTCQFLSQYLQWKHPNLQSLYFQTLHWAASLVYHHIEKPGWMIWVCNEEVEMVKKIGEWLKKISDCLRKSLLLDQEDLHAILILSSTL